MNRRALVKRLSWLVPVCALALACACAVGLILADLFVPYTPFVLRSYTVTPTTVCTGAPVEARITRDFTRQFDTLKLTETWVSKRVPGVPPDRPVAQYQGTLPPSALHATDGFTTATSPLLDKAPTMPGIYRVRIATESHGTRWGFMPAVGNRIFYSNTVTVRDCKGDR